MRRSSKGEEGAQARGSRGHARARVRGSLGVLFMRSELWNIKLLACLRFLWFFRIPFQRHSFESLPVVCVVRQGRACKARHNATKGREMEGKQEAKRCLKAELQGQVKEKKSSRPGARNRRPAAKGKREGGRTNKHSTVAIHQCRRYRRTEGRTTRKKERKKGRDEKKKVNRTKQGSSAEREASQGTGEAVHSRLPRSRRSPTHPSVPILV